MPQLRQLARPLVSRRAALASAAAWLTFQDSADVQAVTRSKRERRNKRRKQRHNRLEASRQCHEEYVPYICGRTPETAAQCTADLTPCCEAAKISCEAKCACYAVDTVQGLRDHVEARSRLYRVTPAFPAYLVVVAP